MRVFFPSETENMDGNVTPSWSNHYGMITTSQDSTTVSGRLLGACLVRVGACPALFKYREPARSSSGLLSISRQVGHSFANIGTYCLASTIPFPFFLTLFTQHLCYHEDWVQVSYP